jgi:hypothetical protein
MKHPFLFVCALLIAATVFSQTDGPRPVLNPDLPALFIAGDSTAARNNEIPIQGWGEPFAGCFDPAKIRIANRAVGGRSRWTFITDGLWDKLLQQGSGIAVY